MGLHDVGCSDRPALPHRCCSPLGGVRHVQTLGCTVTQPDRGAVITSLLITCITARHILKISSYSTHTKQWANNLEHSYQKSLLICRGAGGVGPDPENVARLDLKF